MCPSAAAAGRGSAGGAGCCLGTRLRFLDSKPAETAAGFAACVRAAAGEAGAAVSAGPAADVWAARTFGSADFAAAVTASRTAAA